MANIFKVSMALAFLMTMFSCQKAIGPDVKPGSTQNNLELSVAQGLDDDLGYMEPSFSARDSVDAILALSWGRIRMPFFQQAFIMGHASVIAFTQNANPGPNFHLGGLDMGDVTLRTPDDTLQLKPFRGVQNNFVYLSVNSSPNDGVDIGNHRMMSGKQFFDLFPFNQINFFPDAFYTFSSTGSSAFPAVETNLHTPQNLLTITSPTDGQDVSIEDGFTVSWTGATSRSKILVAITIGHRFEFKDGVRGDKNDLQNELRLNFEKFPIIVKTYKQNIGSVNISKIELQELLKDVDSKVLAINVSAIDFEKENINNRMLGKMIRMHDRLLVTIR